jgi:Xaa-Pro aminopeptidase
VTININSNIRSITVTDIAPRVDWQRHLPALGTMGVDFEQRVN